VSADGQGGRLPACKMRFPLPQSLTTRFFSLTVFSNDAGVKIPKRNVSAVTQDNDKGEHEGVAAIKVEKKA